MDVLGDVATLGKATGADSERAKPTYPAHHGHRGLAGAGALLHAQAIEALAVFGSRADDCAISLIGCCRDTTEMYPYRLCGHGWPG